jgi:two-component system, chemotaxis family, response regulator WspF
VRIAIVNKHQISVETLRRLITSTPNNEVAWMAANGLEAVRRCEADTPDLILMDLAMPVMGGVEAIRQIMSRFPCAILVVTSSVESQAGLVFDALGAGAMDVVSTPSVDSEGNIRGGNELLKKVANIAKIVNHPTSSPPGRNIHHTLPHLAAIGASTGGPKILAEILGRLPKDYHPAVVVIQHVDDSFSSGLASWLDSQTILPVRLAQEGDRPEPGRILLAGGDRHLVFQADRRLTYTHHPESIPYRPSVDEFFKSTARYWPEPGMAVLLTGMGRDGAAGLFELHRAGWRTVAQNEATSTVYGMPKAAVQLGAAEKILSPPLIADELIKFGRNRNHLV